MTEECIMQAVEITRPIAFGIGLIPLWMIYVETECYHDRIMFKTQKSFGQLRNSIMEFLSMTLVKKTLLRQVVMYGI